MADGSIDPERTHSLNRAVNRVASAWVDDDERPHAGLIDEWVFATWTEDGSFGVLSGHRLFGPVSWYWAAVVEAGRPLLHLTEWEIVVRAFDPFIVKGPEMWAEHQLDAPMEQWSLGNEAYFVALDDPDDALGRAYGAPTPLACDLEWYATRTPSEIDNGYEQIGVVHGTIERLHLPNIELVEVPAHRWRRWGAALGALELPPATIDKADVVSELRAPFRFPDGSQVDWFLHTGGWHQFA